MTQVEQPQQEQKPVQAEQVQQQAQPQQEQKPAQAEQVQQQAQPQQEQKPVQAEQEQQQAKPQPAAESKVKGYDASIVFSKEIIEKLTKEAKTNAEKAKVTEEKAEKSKKHAEYWDGLVPFTSMQVIGVLIFAAAMIMGWIPAVAPVAWMVAVAGGVVMAVTVGVKLITSAFAGSYANAYENARFVHEGIEKEHSVLQATKAASVEQVTEFKKEHNLNDAQYETFIRNYTKFIKEAYNFSRNEAFNPDQKKRKVLDDTILEVNISQYFKDNLKDLVKSMTQDSFASGKDFKDLVEKLFNDSYTKQTICIQSIGTATQHAGSMKAVDETEMYSQIVKEIFTGGKADQGKIEKAMTSYPAFHEGHDLSKPVINPLPAVLVENIKALYMKEVEATFVQKVAANSGAEAATGKSAA